MPEAVIRVIELAKDMQIAQPIPGDWLAETGKQFPRSSQSLSLGQLQTLGEVGLQSGRFELAYAVSAAGLERGGSTEANFLLLRALSLPGYQEERRVVCALAAAQLARQHSDMEVLEKAVELTADSAFDDLSLTPEQAATLVQREKAERAFPTPYRPGPDYSDFFAASCDCPACRRKRGEAVSPFEDLEEDDDDSNLDPILDATGLPPEIPPEVARNLFGEATKAIARGESLDSFLNRLIGSGGFGGRRKKGRRR